MSLERDIFFIRHRAREREGAFHGNDDGCETSGTNPTGELAVWNGHSRDERTHDG